MIKSLKPTWKTPTKLPNTGKLRNTKKTHTKKKNDMADQNVTFIRLVYQDAQRPPIYRMRYPE